MNGEPGSEWFVGNGVFSMLEQGMYERFGFDIRDVRDPELLNWLYTEAAQPGWDKQRSELANRVLDRNYAEIKTAVEEAQIADRLALSEFPFERVEAVRRGAHLEQFINDHDPDVRCAVAELGYKPYVFAYDPDPRVRAAVARAPEDMVFTETHMLAGDESPIVRAAVARRGVELLALVNDESPHVRVAVAEQGYKLNVLVEDSDPAVRKAVARQGAYLERLVFDKDEGVRAVARKEYDKWLDSLPEEVAVNAVYQRFEGIGKGSKGKEQPREEKGRKPGEGQTQPVKEGRVEGAEPRKPGELKQAKGKPRQQGFSGRVNVDRDMRAAYASAAARGVDSQRAERKAVRS